jgi:hypothetical protein
VLLGALLISDYAGARFFVQWNRVTCSEADWNFWKRARLIADDGFAVESRESLLLKSCVRQNRIREKFERRETSFCAAKSGTTQEQRKSPALPGF